jgi:hypothetical protein
MHTYCVAVGAGALDHTAVIDFYAKEVDELMAGSYFYCSFTKIYIYMRIGVVAALADRPEKSYTLKTALLGTYGKIASWATAIIPDILADCKKCFLKCLELTLQDSFSKLNMPQCKKCCQWDLMSESKSRKKVPMPKDYPTMCDPNSPDVPYGRSVSSKYLIPVKQTFEWLNCCVNYAAHNVTVGCWKKGVMVDYLRSCSVSTSVRNNLWIKCKPPGAKDVVLVDADDGEITDGCDLLIDLDDEIGVTPKIWKSDLKMNAYIDCAMHLIFHGIVKYCVEEIEAFMKTHAVTPEFEKLVNPYMIDIQSHRLEWCKLKTFP